MIELFSGRVDAIELPEDAVLTPLPLDDEISSLSAILMDSDYYQFLQEGKVVLNDIPILDAGYLIPFKAKAWLDLTERKEQGEHVDSKNIRKHKKRCIPFEYFIDARHQGDTTIFNSKGFRDILFSYGEGNG